VFGVAVVGPYLRFSRLTSFFFDFCPVLALLLLLLREDDDREPPSRDRGTLDSRLERRGKREGAHVVNE